ncbi:MAG: hypothetical protein MK180_02125 [Rhodobacteraceae bacterium]|nr:hypothetical protein [Paracoccaceae bacterium]
MTRPSLPSIVGLLCLAAVVVAAVYVAVQRQGTRLPDGAVSVEAGPNIIVEGEEWKTEIIEGTPEHNSFAVWLNATPPEGKTFAEGEDVLAALDGICEAVAARPDVFGRFGLIESDFQHVDLNIVRAGWRMLPFDVTVYLEDGACTDRRSFQRLFDAVEEDASASRHATDQSFFSTIASFGLVRTNLEFTNTNGKRVIRATYDPVPAYGRTPDTVWALPLCVMTLLSLDREMNVLGIPIEPRKYTEMEMTLGRSSGSSFFRTTRTFGSVSMRLEDGLCIDPGEEGAASG